MFSKSGISPLFGSGTGMGDAKQKKTANKGGQTGEVSISEPVNGTRQITGISYFLKVAKYLPEGNFL